MKYWNRLPFLLLFLLLLGSCRSPQLERQDVPLMWGIRFEGEEALEWINRNLESSEKGKEWMIEIPVVASDSQIPSIPELPLRALSQALDQNDVEFNLAFTTSFVKELFPTGALTDTTNWFDGLQTAIQNSLNAFDRPPKRLIVGNDWKTSEPAEEHWRSLMKNLRNENKIEIGYGWNGDRLSAPKWLDVCDFFALEYPPIADPNPKPYSIQNNPRMATISDSLDKPMFIYRANVMGNFKTIGLKNRLRFWPEEIEVTGLVANSLYAKLPPLDSSSYFGVMQDKEFLNYWNSYQNIH